MEDSMNQFIEDNKGLVTGGLNELGLPYKALQLLPGLKVMYPNQLKNEIVSVRFLITGQEASLEITEIFKPDYPEGIVDEETLAMINQPTYKITRSPMGILNKVEVSETSEITVLLRLSYQFLYENNDIDKLNTTDLFSAAGEAWIIEKVKQENDFN